MGMPQGEELSLAEDMERLGDIGDLVLAGASIEEFALGKYEKIIVAAYVRAALKEGIED